jgi:DNA-binding CsgD family transcriptional regulator
LQAKLATALSWSGRFVEAEHAARHALASCRDHTYDAETLNVLLSATFWRGRPDVALEEAQKGLERPGLTAVEKRLVRCDLSLFLVAMDGRRQEGADLAEHVLSEAGPGEEQTVRQALLVLAAAARQTARWLEAIRLADRGLAVRTERDYPALRLGLHVIRAFSLAQLDRLPESEQALDAAVGPAEIAGGAAMSWYHSQRATLAFRTQRWDDALAEVQTALANAEYLDMQFKHSEDGLALCALIALRRAELSRARSEFESVSAEPARGVRLYEHWPIWTRAMLQEADGQPGDALDILMNFWLVGNSTTPHETLHFLCPDIIRLAAALGERQLLASVVADLRDQAGRLTIPSVQAAAALAEAVAEADPELLGEAAALYQKAGWPLFVGLANEQRALCLARAGRAAGARIALDQALEAYGATDARWDADRAAAALRQHGISRGVRGARQRPKTGWPALTDTERRVAALVAEGHSNPAIAARMYLSRRTIATHVSSILNKLGLSSRVGLAVEASRAQDVARG